MIVYAAIFVLIEGEAISCGPAAGRNAIFINFIYALSFFRRAKTIKNLAFSIELPYIE